MDGNVSHTLRARVSLSKRAFRFTHSLGQNFLLDDDALRAIVALSGVGEGDCVLEIGPGAGVLTAHLLDAGARVVSVELDQALAEVYADVVGEWENAKIVFADAMKADLSAIVADAFGEGAAFSIVANLPYYITADFLLRALSLLPKPERITVMVQKEAAERALSQPGQKNWCALAATIQYFARAEAVMDAPASLFTPPPHVDSRLLRLDVYAPDERPVQPVDEGVFLSVLRAAFFMRRKTLVNNLTAALSISREKALNALAQAGLDARVRGEALSLDELRAVSDALV